MRYRLAVGLPVTFMPMRGRCEPLGTQRQSTVMPRSSAADLSILDVYVKLIDRHLGVACTA